MKSAIISILPLFGIIAAGVLLRRFGPLRERDGRLLLKLVYYAGMPALIFTLILSIELSPALLRFILLPPCVILLSVGALYLWRRLQGHPPPARAFGALLVGASVMNTGFLLPFVQQLYGAEGLARLVIIDTVNAILTFSIVYLLAAREGSGGLDMRRIYKRIILSPPLWALVVALMLRLANLQLPELVMEAIKAVAYLVGPSILLALGILLQLKVRHPRWVVIGLAFRFVVGMAIGLGLVYLLGLSGLDTTIVLLAAGAPIGLNAMTIAQLEELDATLAASLVSVGLIVGVVLLPVYLLFV